MHDQHKFDAVEWAAEFVLVELAALIGESLKSVGVVEPEFKPVYFVVVVVGVEVFLVNQNASAPVEEDYGGFVILILFGEIFNFKCEAY